MAIVKLAGVRIAFAQLFQAKAGEDGGTPKFGGCFIIDPKSPAVKQIEAAMKEVAVGKWKDKGEDILADLIDDKRVCFQKKPRKSKDGAVYEGFEGMYSVNATNAARPTVIDRDKSPLTEKDGRPYSGCYVNASIELWAQDNKFGRRINASLRGVQFFKDGDAFGGGAPASADEFEDLSTEEESLVD